MSADVLAAPVQPQQQRRLPEGWPLVVLFLGFPIWWVLGLGVLAFFLAAIPMLAYLWQRRRTIVVPGGFEIWVLFLLVVLASGLELFVTAPYTSQEGAGPGRVLTFAVRFAWYISATTAMLYVINIPEARLPFSRVSRLFAFMFIVTAVGGIIGLLVPRVEFVGLLFAPFADQIRAVPFAYQLVRVDVADLQEVLGYLEARPKAPFAYTNTWGANLSLFLPFFLFAWASKRTIGRSVVAVLILGAATVGAVYSLNRALWIAILVGIVYALIQLVRVRPRALMPILVGLGAAFTVFLLSGLGGLIQERLNSPHSNARRIALAQLTWRSLWEGSPVVGYGTTRQMQGSFASIAGSDTPTCVACAAPPLGTQGYLWLLLFATGIVGTLLFLGFLLFRLSRHVRSKDVPTMFAMPVLIFFLVMMPFYDLLDAPLFTLMTAMGLMWRRETGGVLPVPDDRPAVSHGSD